MNDLLDNNGIKEFAQGVLSAKENAQKETESIIAFLEKNYVDIKMLIDSNRVTNTTDGIIGFVNITCKTKITLNDDITKYINKKFNIKVKMRLLDYSKQVSYVLSYMILLVFWMIFLYMLNTIAFWWDDMSMTLIASISLGISSFHLFCIFIFSSEK